MCPVKAPITIEGEEEEKEEEKDSKHWEEKVATLLDARHYAGY